MIIAGLYYCVTHGHSISRWT